MLGQRYLIIFSEGIFYCKVNLAAQNDIESLYRYESTILKGILQNYRKNEFRTIFSKYYKIILQSKCNRLSFIKFIIFFLNRRKFYHKSNKILDSFI